MSIKNRLFQPVERPPVEIQLFGQPFPVKPLPLRVMSSYEKQLRSLEKDNDTDRQAKVALNLVLDSVVNEKGEPLIDSCDPEGLMDIYSAKEILSAMTAILEFNYMSDSGGEEAKKD